ncbi:MAG: site-specific integrase [Tepidisphaeraceae bacterium]
MARPKGSNATPSYCLHKPSNRGYATFDGNVIYFPGDYGTRASRAAYDRTLSEFLVNGRRLPDVTSIDDITISEIIATYWKHVEGYYSEKEAGVIRLALRPLNRLYGSTLAAKFGPLALKAVQAEMVGMDWSRGVVNKQIIRIRQMFRWAVANEMVPAAVYQALATLSGLKRGKTEARETAPIKPVPPAHVDATLNAVSPAIADMIRLQLLTGARPGEICGMTVGSLDTRGDVWVCRPSEHKTAHRGYEREIRLGPQAQEIVKKYLKPDIAAFLFSPDEVERDRRAVQRLERKSPVQPSQVQRAVRSRKRGRKFAFGFRYTVDSYRRAIWRGCDKANPPPPPLAKQDAETLDQWKARLTAKQREELRKWRSDHRWHPHQLRHNFATNVRREHGIEMAKIILGHRSVAMTEIYAEADVKRATEIMGAMG